MNGLVCKVPDPPATLFLLVVPKPRSGIQGHLADFSVPLKVTTHQTRDNESALQVIQSIPVYPFIDLLFPIDILPGNRPCIASRPVRG